MKMRRFNLSKRRALTFGATARIISSMVMGAVWGGGWALCVESYQNEGGISFLGNTISPLQALSIGIVAAIFALATLAFVFHPHRPFWRPLLAALIVAFLAAMSFYAALAVLATMLPNVAPSTLEEFCLPLGWSIDNAVLFITLSNIDARCQHRSDDKRREKNEREIVKPLFLLLLVWGLWLIFFAARSIVSISVMLTIVPSVVWTVLTVFAEKRLGVT